MAVLANKESNQHLWLNPLVFAALILYVTFIGARELSLPAYIGGWLIQLFCLGVSYRELKTKGTINYISTTLYLWLPLGLMAIWFMQNQDVSMEYVLFYLIAIWLFDSMAYVVGKSIGKNPIFPKVSPKKTIEGTIGGAVVTVALMYFVNMYWLQLPANAPVLAAVIAFFATFGDFVESYMKRKIGAKDSGNLIPGHGGILDRIDSIYLSALPYLVILLLL